jgi:sugar/nucleoside kinase (ribokinase family)
MTRKGILTGGTWCLDRNLLIDCWPAENGRADVIEAEPAGGGSASNMAVGLKKLDPDLPVATIGLVGDDADGRFLLAQAEAHGIDHSQLKLIPGATTDYTHAYSSLPHGLRTHISWFGTSHLLTPDHFDLSRCAHRIFHLGLPGIHRLMDGPWQGDANGWVATLKRARAAGLMTNMELASLPPERLAAIVRPCLPQLDYLVVNDSEIGGITGSPTVSGGHTDFAACLAAARLALAQGPLQLVAVHFPRGAIVVTRDDTVLTRPSVNVPVSEIKGANGAGDAFAAGLLYGLHENWPLADAVALAHATAAASLRRISTTGAVESWRQCLALAAAWGWRNALPSL